MAEVRLRFLADMQLGCHASLRGMPVEEAASRRARGMRVVPVPATTGFE